jgi:hypothetical protein
MTQIHTFPQTLLNTRDRFLRKAKHAQNRGQHALRSKLIGKAFEIQVRYEEACDSVEVVRTPSTSVICLVVV